MLSKKTLLLIKTDLENKIKEKHDLLNASFHSELLQIYKELKENIKNISNAEALKLIANYKIKQMQLFEQIEKQRDPKITQDLVRLENDLGEIKHQLFLLENKGIML